MILFEAGQTIKVRRINEATPVPGNLANTASRTRRVAHMRAWLTLIAHSTLRSPLRSLFRACKALRHLRSPQTSCARHSSFYRQPFQQTRYDAKMPALARAPAQRG